MTELLVCPVCRQRDQIVEHIHPSDKRTVLLCRRDETVVWDEREEERKGRKR